MKRRLLLLATSAALAGCAGPQVADYAGQTPKLDLRTYFNGTLDAYGVFTDRSGKVVKRFTVLMVCTWTTQKRIWRLRRQADGSYTGRADDVVGEAVGAESGNAFNWRYTLALPVDGSVYNVQFDDWMYLMTDKVMLNKATMSKLGIKLGEVTLSFTKR